MRRIECLVKKIGGICKKEHREGVALIKKLQKCYGKNVYIKYGRDKYGSLIVLRFDIEQFVKNIELPKVIGVSLEEQKKFRTTLKFTYERGIYSRYDEYMNNKYKNKNDYFNTAYVHICDFIGKGKTGDGTFILENLEEIISVINQKIIKLKNKEPKKYESIGIIRGIDGNIEPGEHMPKAKLVEFYKKNGFRINPDDIKAASIFKEI